MSGKIPYLPGFFLTVFAYYNQVTTYFWINFSRNLIRTCCYVAYLACLNPQASPGCGPVGVRGANSGSLPTEAAEKHRGQGQCPLRRRGRLWSAQGVHRHTEILKVTGQIFSWSALLNLNCVAIKKNVNQCLFFVFLLLGCLFRNHPQCLDRVSETQLLSCSVIFFCHTLA